MSNATEMSTNTTEAPACGGLSEDVYDQPYHIGAVFILFAVSLAGTAIPFAIQRFGTPGNPAVDICHRIGMAFGTGVVLATAFIHMLPPAQAALTSPCVAEWFKTNLEYPWAPLIAMVTILVLHGIEYTTQVFMEQRPWGLGRPGHSWIQKPRPAGFNPWPRYCHMDRYSGTGSM